MLVDLNLVIVLLETVFDNNGVESFAGELEVISCSTKGDLSMWLIDSPLAVLFLVLIHELLLKNGSLHVYWVAYYCFHYGKTVFIRIQVLIGIWSSWLVLIDSPSSLYMTEFTIIFVTFCFNQGC